MLAKYALKLKSHLVVATRQRNEPNLHDSNKSIKLIEYPSLGAADHFDGTTVDLDMDLDLDVVYSLLILLMLSRRRRQRGKLNEKRLKKIAQQEMPRTLLARSLSFSFSLSHSLSL